MTEPISEPNPAEPGAPAEPTEEPAEPTEPTEEEAAEEEEQTPAEGQPGAPEGTGPVGAVSEKEIEKMFKKVDTANAGYAKRLGDIMGEESQVLEPCPRCSDPFLGFIFPPLMKPASAEVKAAVLVSVGEEAPNVTERDNYSRRCEVCDGWGKVLSGSRVNREYSLSCIVCGGRGWVAVGSERASGAAPSPVAVASNGQEQPIEQPPDADPWGRGPNDPDYGRLPQYAGTR